MKSWVFDGSLDGLLDLVGRAYAGKVAPDAVINRGRTEGELFGPEAEPETEEEKPNSPGSEVGRNPAELLRAASPRLYAAALKAWMSEENVEAALLAVAADIGRRGEAALGDWSRAELAALAASVRRVDREIHRLVGLARFSLRSDGLYSAPLEPDHNVLPALAPHFERRFGNSGLGFALVDLRRACAILCRGRKTEAFFGAEALALLPDGSDGEDVTLWRRYYRSTENPARRNLALQRRLMPRRYWKHLVELSEPEGR